MPFQQQDNSYEEADKKSVNRKKKTVDKLTKDKQYFSTTYYHCFEH